MNIMYADNGVGMNLVGAGKITIIMVMNLGRFMAEEDTKSRELFRTIRGSERYIHYLKRLKIPNLFTRLSTNVLGGDPWIEVQGYEIGIFRRQLFEDWFLPTYELDKTSALSKISPELSQFPLFQKEWDQWDHYKIRLTRNGFIQVKLTRKFQQENLYDLSIQLLESERDEFRLKLREIAEDLPEDKCKAIMQLIRHPLQWQLSYQVISLFIEQLKEIRFNEREVIKLKMPEEERKLPIRDQYTIIFFRELSDCHNSSIKKLSSSEIFENNHYAQVIQTLWDGTLIGDREKNCVNFPNYWGKEIDKLSNKNLSMWNDEICLIGSERTIIYCPMSESAIYLPFQGERAKEGIRYNDYWKCIIRGIEHIIALRAELHMIEAYTNFEMNQISEITQALTTHGISRKEKKGVERLSKRVSNLVSMLNSIRNVLVAPSAYRACYAKDKFERLSQMLGLDQIESHVKKNIEELNFFISHYNDLVIQQNGERLQRLAILFGIGVGFLGLASLLKDTKELNDFLQPITFNEAVSRLWYMITHLLTLPSMFIVWIIFMIFFFIIWKLYTYFSE